MGKGRRTTTYQRQDEVRNLIRTGLRRVDEIARVVGVSPSTIRRDLIYLEDEGKITRTLGGALPSLRFLEQGLAERESVAVAAKAGIGAAAAQLLSDDIATVFVDAGSTCAQVLPRLRNRRALTVVTRGLEIALALADDPEIEVIVVRGKVYKKSHGVAGALTSHAIERFHVDIAFLGCDAVHPTNGVGEPTIDEAPTRRNSSPRAPTSLWSLHARRSWD